MSIASWERVPIVGWLIGEGRALGRALAGPALPLVALLAALVLGLVYQVRPSYHIDVGGPTDRPYLESIHASEGDAQRLKSPDPQVVRYARWRWTMPESVIKLPGVGQQAMLVRVELSGSRPAGAPPPGDVQIFANNGPLDPGRLLLTIQPQAAPTTYELHLAANPDLRSGDLRLTIRTSTPFTPTGDPRVLGVILFNVDATPEGAVAGLILPPVQVAFPLLAALLLWALLLLRLGWGVGGATLGGLGGLLAAAAFLLWDRLWLTAFPWVLPQVVGVALLLCLVLGPLVGGLYRWGGIRWPFTHRRALLTIFALGVIIRLGGQLHPEIFIPDVGFHANRFIEVLGGNLLFTIYSAEWGNHRTFYLPTVYMFMAPLQWLLNDRFLVVRVFTVVLDTSAVFLLYFLAARALRSGRAGLWAAILFLALPQGVLVISWGITANLFAQWMMLAVVTVLVVFYERLQRPLVWLGFMALCFIALLSHPGTVQLTAVIFLSYWLYYSNWVSFQTFELQSIFKERQATDAGIFQVRVGGSVNDLTLGLFAYRVYSRGAQVWEGLAGFWNEAWAYYKTMPLAWTALGLLAAAPATRMLRRLRTLSVGWVLASVVFALVGLFTNLYVRYPLFLLPQVALGSGALLEGLRARGRAGQVLLVCVLGTIVVSGLALWWWRIQFYLK